MGIDWLTSRNPAFVFKNKTRYSYFGSASRLVIPFWVAKCSPMVSQRIFFASSVTAVNCCWPTTTIQGRFFCRAEGRVDLIVGPSNPRSMGRRDAKGPLEDEKRGSGARARITPKENMTVFSPR